MQTVDLKPLVFRRYVYVLRFVMKGKGTGLGRLKLEHDIQHSQRPLPALGRGENKITFSAGPQEGTITIEGAMEPSSKGKQLLYGDFHPQLDGYKPGDFPHGGRRKEHHLPREDARRHGTRCGSPTTSSPAARTACTSSKSPLTRARPGKRSISRRGFPGSGSSPAAT